VFRIVKRIVKRIGASSLKDSVMLTNQEIALLQDVIRRLLGEATTASPNNANFIFTMELETRLQPVLRIRSARVFHQLHPAVSTQSVRQHPDK
jgi:hypothetical protein